MNNLKQYLNSHKKGALTLFVVALFAVGAMLLGKAGYLGNFGDNLTGNLIQSRGLSTQKQPVKNLSNPKPKTPSSSPNQIPKSEINCASSTFTGGDGVHNLPAGKSLCHTPSNTITTVSSFETDFAKVNIANLSNGSSGDFTLSKNTPFSTPLNIGNLTLKYTFQTSDGARIEASTSKSNASAVIIPSNPQLNFNTPVSKLNSAQANIQSNFACTNVTASADNTYTLCTGGILTHNPTGIKIKIVSGNENEAKVEFTGADLSATTLHTGGILTLSDPNYKTALTISYLGLEGGRVKIQTWTLSDHTIPTGNRNGLCYDNDCWTKNPDYVIVTRPIFQNAIQDFVKWKQGNGFKVGVVTVDYIQSRYQKADPSKSIREAIKALAGRGGKYFVLIGDSKLGDHSYTDNSLPLDRQTAHSLTIAWNVPTGYYCRPDATGYPGYDLCIEGTDLYYADFNDSHWQENKDGYILGGIYHNEHTLFESTLKSLTASDNALYGASPLVFSTIVSRIPIRSPYEFADIFAKTKSYVPANGAIQVGDDSLRVGASGENINFQDHCSSPIFSEDVLATKSSGCQANGIVLTHLFEKNGIPFSRDFSFDSANSNTELTRSKAKTLILGSNNLTISMIHGIHHAMQVMSSIDLFQAIHSPQAMIFSSCLSGSFYMDDLDSLTEAALKAKNGPALVIYPSNTYSLLRDSLAGMTVGEAYFNVNQINFRFLTLASLLGDPSLKLFK